MKNRFIASNSIGAALCLLMAAPQLSGHDCRTRELTIVVGEARDDVYVVEADHHTENTEYSIVGFDTNIVKVVPLQIETINLYLNILGMSPGQTLVRADWYYPPTFASGQCSVLVTVRPPPAANSAGNFGASGRAGDPVNTFTGELTINETADLFIPGPMALSFQRYYASGLRRSFVFSRLGDNWRHNFEWSVHFIGNVLVTVDPKGRVTRYTKASTITNEWEQLTNLDKPREVIQEILPTENHFHLFDPQEQRIYKFSVPTDDQSYRLVRVSDTRGNSLNLLYTRDGDLREVNDGLGRTLTYTYDFDPNPATRKLISVSDGTRTVSFTHTGDLLTGVTDAGANSMAYEYDLAHADPGLLRRKILPRGNSPYVYEWNDVAKVETQADANGHPLTFVYNGLTTVIVDARGSNSVHVHDTNGTLISSTDGNGRTRVISPDTTGRRSGVAQPSGSRASVGFSPAGGLPVAITNAAGQVIRYTYQERTVPPGFKVRDLARVDFPDGGFITYTYDANGNLVSMTDRANRTWTRTYDARGRLLTARNPLGGTYTNTYNPDGTRATASSPAGNVTRFTYDALKRVTRVTWADGPFRSFTYDHANRVRNFTDENVNVTARTYDVNGNLTTITDPSGNQTRFFYDANDRITNKTDRTGASVAFTYNELGLPGTARLSSGDEFGYEWNGAKDLAEVELPDGTSFRRLQDVDGQYRGAVNPNNETNRVDRDAAGNIVGKTSTGGDQTTYTHDALGRFKSRTTPSGEREVYSYGADDQLQSILVEPLGLLSQYQYNALGLLTNYADPRGQSWAWNFDNFGRALSATDPLGNVISHGYDARNRINQSTFPGGLGTLSLQYDNVGNVTRRQFSDGTVIQYAYDRLNRLTNANGVTLRYDTETRIIECNGISVVRSPNHGRIDSITLAPGKTVSYTYNAAGMVTGITDWIGVGATFSHGNYQGIQRANGTETRLWHNAEGRLTNVQHLNVQSFPAGRIAVGRDAGGRPGTALQSGLPVPPLPAAANLTYTYDGAYQVNGFIYDPLGRLTADDRRSYTWDLASRVTGFSASGNATTFSHNAYGHPLTSTRAGVTRGYVWNYAFPIPAISILREGGNDRWYLVHHPSGRLLYRISALNGARQFYHFDERANTVMLTDDAGAVLVAYSYLPYGEAAASTAAVENPFTFVGEYGVMQFGDLYLMGHRFYDSVSARFISRERARPHVDPRTFNPYQYAVQNPLQYFDPFGTDSTDVGEADQHTGSGGALAAGSRALQDVGNAASIAGTAVGDKADEVAELLHHTRQTGSILDHELGNYVDKNKGLDDISRKWLPVVEDYAKETDRLASQAEKLAGASKTLKVIGAVGDGFTAIDIGSELWKLYDKIFAAQEFSDSLEIQLYRVFVTRSAAAWDLYRKGKKTEDWLRSSLRIYQIELQHALLWNDFLDSADTHINFWTAVGNIYGAFVPGFGLVGTEGLSEAAHRHIWQPIYGE